MHVTITDTQRDRPTLEGFGCLWVKYVTGFNPAECCARSLVGRYEKRWGQPPRQREGVPVGRHELSPEPGEVVYLCGVARGGYANNLHMPVLPDDSAGAHVETWNGYRISVFGGRLLDIRPVPHDLPCTSGQRRCRNYRWAAHHYGHVAAHSVQGQLV